MLTDNLIIYISSFMFIWLGAGLILGSLSKISRRLKVSSFTLSFFILGILTSIPEFALGLTAISGNNPEIFVGNLLGGVTVIFLFVIPILAILGNGVTLSHELESKTLLFSQFVILVPAVLVLDKKVTNLEGLVMILLYLILFYFIQRKSGVLDEENTELMRLQSYSLIDILKIILGVVIIFTFSRIIVDKTEFFGNMFNISPFYISFVFLSLGTNLPELSIAIRSVSLGKKQIAFGDYLGSAAANTFLFGVLTIINQGEVLTVNHFFTTFLFILVSLSLFYFFTRSKNNISRQEGLIMLFVYILFVFLELARI